MTLPDPKPSEKVRDGWFGFGPESTPWRSRGAPPEHATDTPWCLRERRRLDAIPVIYAREARISAETRAEQKKMPVVRCPDCGRRLQVMTVFEQEAALYPYLPPHKVRFAKADEREVKKARKAHKRRGFGPRRGG